MTTLTHHWRNYFARGEPSGSASVEMLRLIYGLWLVAFLLKHGGAIFDFAYHFRFFFDEFSLPHNIIIAGTTLALGVLIYQTWTGVATTARGLFLIWAGWIFFLVSLPLDLLEHLINGLDLTTWSLTHFMLYTGTTLMLVGVLYNWLKIAPTGALRIIVAVSIWTLLLDDVMFPLEQQEFGYVAYNAFLRGVSTASPELLVIVGDNAVRYAIENTPHWVYPLWLTVTASLLLIMARRIQGWQWTATAVVSLYLVFRFTAQASLTSFQFPGSFIPVMLFGAGVLIDLAARYQWKPSFTALGVTVSYYAVAAVVGRATVMPDFELWTAPIAFVLLWIGIATWEWARAKVEVRVREMVEGREKKEEREQGDT